MLREQPKKWQKDKKKFKFKFKKNKGPIPQRLHYKNWELGPQHMNFERT